ncbi:putative hydrolase [Actinacidiphila reveromycinica]|uniref:Putative hydrolase n=1 Tax=Actinacidiphila reveromycinica TaxID=659352 RepID=A0A7U3VP88_9ACTN|nr:alpha/beta hydrolase [Streptomyces sp. SN-593]BBA98428.1 putative hydrolase [Streptomyces sp. SN-593]
MSANGTDASGVSGVSGGDARARARTEAARRVRPGQRFSVLPVPDTVEVLELDVPVGALTALRARPADRALGTALLVPGFTGSKEDFLPLLPLLADRGFDAWAFSQRGQGDSAAPAGEESYTLDAFSGDVIHVASLLADLTGRRHAHLVGHSFGGTVARAAAISGGREAFADLTMLCSGPHGWPGRKAAEEARLRGAGKRTDLWTLDRPEAARTARRAPEQLSPAERFLRERSLRTSVDNLLGAIGVLADPSDSTPLLAATGLPVLVAHGRHDDAWPQEWQRTMAERLGARHEIIADSGHLPNQENPVATADLLSDFWSHTR